MLHELEGYIDQTRVLRALLLDIVAEHQRLSEEKLRLFLDPLELWVQELLRRPLPRDWRDRLAAYLAYWEADEGYVLSPESTRILSAAIETLARRRGLPQADAEGGHGDVRLFGRTRVSPLCVPSDATSPDKLARASELPYNDGHNPDAPARSKPIAIAAVVRDKERPEKRNEANAAGPSGLLSPADIRYIPGRVRITHLMHPQPFTPEPGAGGILSSNMHFFAQPISGAFTNAQRCQVCNDIGFVQITSGRLEIRGSTITSIYWLGQLLNSNRSMHVDGTVPYEGHSIDPTSNRDLPFVDQPGGYNGHYWDGTTVTLLKQDFEVHVVCLSGLEKGAPYGGVMWGHQFTLTTGVGMTLNDYSVNRWHQRWDQPNNIFKTLVAPRL